MKKDGEAVVYKVGSYTKGVIVSEIVMSRTSLERVEKGINTASVKICLPEIWVKGHHFIPLTYCWHSIPTVNGVACQRWGYLFIDTSLSTPELVAPEKVLVTQGKVMIKFNNWLHGGEVDIVRETVELPLERVGEYSYCARS